MPRVRKTKRLLKLSTLREHRACPSQRTRFKHMFGEQVWVTEKTAIKSSGAFDFEWAARNLLSLSSYLKWVSDANRAARKAIRNDYQLKSGDETVRQAYARLFAKYYLRDVR